MAVFDLPATDIPTAALLDGSMVLAAGVDIAADRVEIEVVTLGRDGQSWTIPDGLLGPS